MFAEKSFEIMDMQLFQNLLFCVDRLLLHLQINNYCFHRHMNLNKSINLSGMAGGLILSFDKPLDFHVTTFSFTVALDT